MPAAVITFGPSHTEILMRKRKGSGNCMECGESCGSEGIAVHYRHKRVNIRPPCLIELVLPTVQPEQYIAATIAVYILFNIW